MNSCKYPGISWKAFVNELQHAIDLFVPSSVVPISRLQSQKARRRPLVVRKCERKKHYLWKRVVMSPCDSGVRARYRDCVHEWRRLVRQNEILAEERLITSKNLGAFYRYVYKHTTNRCGIGDIMDQNGKPVTNDRDKANCFNKFFSSVGIVDNNILPHCPDVVLNSVLDSIVINESDVLQSVNKLKSNSSSGPDHLPPTLFKRLKYCVSHPLALMYNQLISVGVVPAEWLTAHITPVFKIGVAGDIKLSSNFPHLRT